ncbi:MAG: flavin reductase family protein [Elusimicrobia bacterium]|nr:flavin reductase family protein [Elusimicrobiota bacterium]
MDRDPAELEARERYRLMIGLIQPRPIAWVSTVSADGAPNLAPFSFFTGITANPMSVCFAPVNDRAGRRKDTLLNVEQTREFVVNFVDEDNAAKMNETAAAYPRGVSEFEKAGLTPVPSVKVRPPRVAESPAAFECALDRIVDLGDGPLGGHLVIGRVVRVHCADRLLKGPSISHKDRRAVGRLEGDWYCRATDDFELPRPEVPK